MNTRMLIATAGLTVMSNAALALCLDGPPFACMINGRPGTRECAGGRITPCMPNSDGPSQPPGPSGTGKISPRYYVLTIVYAPPGTKGGASTSNVTYGSGSTTGTTVSSSKSFKQGYGVKALTGAGALGNGVQIGVNFTYNHSSTDDASVTITKSTTSTILATGPASDGIDHNHDLIYLWLNPTIDVKLTSNSAAWSIEGGVADVQYVYVGWLKDPITMPPGVARVLQHYGLTPQDYADILKQDKFANATPVLSSRYQQLNTTFPYEPPFAAGDPVPTLNFNVTNTNAQSSGTTAENEYKVEASIKADVGFFLKASLELDGSWDWDNKSTNSTAATSTQVAAVTVGGPSFGYTGSTDIAVYYDSIFKTFVFVPLDAGIRPGLQGVLTAANGRPLVFSDVVVKNRGVTYHTITDAKGRYRVFGAVTGPATIQAAGSVRSVGAIPVDRTFDFKLLGAVPGPVR